MRHRHLTDDRLTPAAIDDVIERGHWDDWVRLRAAVRSDARVRADVARVCAARTREPGAQRHHFWQHYVERLAAVG
jgi:hypothetical protein